MMQSVAALTGDFGFSPSARSLSQKGIRKTMTKKDKQFIVSCEAFGHRWAEFLREKYNKPCAQKLIARDFGCEPRTAKAWLAGQAPLMRHFGTAAQLFGIAAVLGVLFPASDIHKKTLLLDELQELRSRLDRLSNELGRLDHDCNGHTTDREGCR